MIQAAPGLRRDAVRRLADKGLSAYPALKRLAARQDLRRDVLAALDKPEYSWCLALHVGMAGAGNEWHVRVAAIESAENISGQKFLDRSDWGNREDLACADLPKTYRVMCQVYFVPGWLDRGHKQLLDWWEREGRARYGRDGK